MSSFRSVGSGNFVAKEVFILGLEQLVTSSFGTVGNC